MNATTLEPKPYLITHDRARLATVDTGILFVDTTGDEHLRPGLDHDLSHWYPNRTLDQYRADTSGAIALRFVHDNPDHPYLVLNDHADTDGVVSLFVLVYPTLALEHANLLAQVAAMGDFSFWGDRGAIRLYVALSQKRARLGAAGSPVENTFRECVTFLRDYLQSDRPPYDRVTAKAADAFERSASLAATRALLGPRLVEYRRRLTSSRPSWRPLSASADREEGPAPVHRQWCAGSRRCRPRSSRIARRKTTPAAD
jgi:hypothetical protein